MAVVDVKDVAHVAYLARLRLEERELAQLSAQLDEILKYVQQLQAISTDQVEPTSHVLPLSNVMRPDQIKKVEVSDEVLDLAPARHGQFFKVPKILD